MNDESIKLILRELRKAFPSSNFHFNLRVFKEGLFGLALIQNVGDQRDDFLFVQVGGASLAEVQNNLFAAVVKLLTSKRDEMNAVFVQETSRVEKQNSIYEECINALSETKLST